jgi:tRNA-dihydrouridine synthase A
MADWDRRFFGNIAADQDPPDRDAVEAAMVAYMLNQHAERGEPWLRISRHMLGLRNGQTGARRWRQVWSDHRLRDEPADRVWRLATAARAEPPYEARVQRVDAAA